MTKEITEIQQHEEKKPPTTPPEPMDDPCLTQMNSSLESELMMEIEKEVVYTFVALQLGEMKDRHRMEKAAMVDLIEGFEREMEGVFEEKRAIKEAKKMKESEIACVNSKLQALISHVGEEKSSISSERKVDSMDLGESNHLVDVLKRDIEKMMKAKDDSVHNLKIQMDELVKEKQEIKTLNVLKEAVIVHQKEENMRLIEQTINMEVQCTMFNNTMKIQKAGFEGCIEKFTREIKYKDEAIQNQKTQGKLFSERMRYKSDEFRKKISTLEKSNQNQSNTIKQLETEISKAQASFDATLEEEKLKLEKSNEKILEMEKLSTNQINKIKQLEKDLSNKKAAINRVKTEMEEAQASCDDTLKEKTLELMKSNEEISKMKKDVEETRKKEKTETQKLVAEKKKLAEELVKTKKEHEDMKAKLKLCEGKKSQIMNTLKDTHLIRSSMEDDDDVGIDQEIKKVCKDNEVIVEEQKSQLELVNKRKRFWTWVSSATTILAAVSVAYNARSC